MTTIAVADADDVRLDDYRALNDQAFRRRYEGDRIFIVEGFVAIDRLIESGHVVRSVLLAPSRVDRFAANAAVLEPSGTPVYVAERDVIAEVVGFDLHRGVIACAERKSSPTIEELTARSRRLAVLEGLNDAENLGAIARAARAFGIDGLVIDPTCTDPYSRRTVRVSMGEVLTLPVARVAAWSTVLEQLGAAGFETWAMTPAPGSTDLWELPCARASGGVSRRGGPGPEPLVTGRRGSSRAHPDRCRRRLAQRRPGRCRHVRRHHPALSSSRDVLDAELSDLVEVRAVPGDQAESVLECGCCDQCVGQTHS